MITFEGTLTGSRIGVKLSEDAEEFGFCLDALAEDFNRDELWVVEDYASDKAGVAAFLRELADAIHLQEEADF